jgi:cytidylate kinase
MKKQIITIAGRPGSGKSTTAKGVADALGFEHFSGGDFFRLIGNEMGIELLRANRTAETNEEIDRRVDGKLQELGRTRERMVIDARTAWHWMPESYKVFLDLDLKVAAARILANMDEARMVHEHIPHDPSDYAKLLQQRLESEARRYEVKYHVDAFDKSNFDLVVDTASNGIDQVVDSVLSGYQAWFKK